MRSLPAVVSSSIALFIIWCCLTLSLRPEELVLGAAVSLITAFATGGAFTGNLFRLLKPSRLIALIDYGLYFLFQMIRANIDVFFRILRLRIVVRPGIVSARIPLDSQRGRVIVANSITLTPGTLTVDLRGNTVFVHWISLPDGDVHQRTREMVEGFARRVGRIID